MDLRVFVEPHLGASYEDQLRLARAAEDAGYGAFFRSDHYLDVRRGRPPGPTDAWVTLAGLARETSTIRLGTLVSSVTFRHPGPLAISVAQVDAMSGGRVEFGLGAGWMEAEHTAYGIPFPPVGERFDALEDALAAITGMWATPEGERFSYEGPTLRLDESPGLPKPAQRPSPPVVIGGAGKRRTPALAARFADEFNLPFASMEQTRAQFERVAAACRESGRDPEGMVWSVALQACVGRDDAEVARRAEAIGRSVDDLRQTGLAGSPAEVVDRIGQWREATGTQRVYLQLLDLLDVDHVELIAAEVMPHL